LARPQSMRRVSGPLDDDVARERLEARSVFLADGDREVPGLAQVEVLNHPRFACVGSTSDRAPVAVAHLRRWITLAHRSASLGQTCFQPGAIVTNVCDGPKREMGDGIAASPHCAERRICRYSLAGSAEASPPLRSWLTSSGVASGRGSVRRQILDVSRPFLDRPSFRAFRSLAGLAAATERSTLPAPLAGWSNAFSIRLHPEGFQPLVRAPSPAGGDRIFGPWSPSVRLPFPPVARGRCPDHHLNMRLPTSRSKRNLWASPCG